jgi:hypothetical protein
MSDIVMHFSIIGGHILQVAARNTSWRRPLERAIKWDAVEGYITPSLAKRLNAMPSVVASITEDQLVEMVTAAVQGDLVGRTTWAPPKSSTIDAAREGDDPRCEPRRTGWED